MPPRLRFDARALGRRLAVFWIVWTALLLAHEFGHVAMARREGLLVERVTVGVGPVLWRADGVAGSDIVLRLVPVAGITRVRAHDLESDPEEAVAPSGQLGSELAILSGGALATSAVILGFAAVVAATERRVRRRCVWGRVVIADALVLTVFNFLPIPPLDGGRAALSLLATWAGAPLSGDALFWLHLGGLALAIVPMMLWTRWTHRMDRVAMRWGAPPSGQP